MFRKKPVSACLAAEVENLTTGAGRKRLFRKKIGPALGVPHEFGNLFVTRPFPAAGPGVFYQIPQELVKHDGEKEKNGKPYHESRRLIPSHLLTETAGTAYPALCTTHLLRPESAKQGDLLHKVA